MRRAAPRVLVSLAFSLAFLARPATGDQGSRPTPLAVNGRPPVSPVLSPPLRDVSPVVARGVDRHTVRNLEPPHPAVAPGAPSRPDPVVQGRLGSTQPTPAGVNFDGIPANGFAPPDSDGRVGPNHYVQWINVEFAIYDKSGTMLYGPAQGNTLFTGLGPASPCVTHNDGDPNVVYDQLADRWIGTQFVVGASPAFSHQCVAISTTGDPLGSYYLYDFVTDATNFVDYPHWGVWPDSYYMTAHLFNAAGSSYLGQTLHAFERSKMLAGLPARVVGVNLGVNFAGALPSDLDGLTPPPPGSANYVIAPGAPEWDGSPGDVLHVWNASATWGSTPSLSVSGPTDVAAAAFNADLCGFSPGCVPQPDPTNGLDAIPGRLMWRLAYRNNGSSESLVLNHTVNAAAAAGHATNQAAVRWYEVRSPGTSPTIFQQGTYAPDSDWRWMGSIAMDSSGNMALGYSKSSDSLFPEIDVTGRLSSDPAGTMGSEAVMKAGLGSQIDGLTRWGDYTAMTVDPRDGCTFWYTNQYQPADGSFNWATRIGSFRFPSCVSPARGTITGTVYDTTTLLPIQHALVTTDSGFSGATDQSGRYTIVLPPGSYSVLARADQRDCTPSSTKPANVTSGATVTLNFALTGAPVLTLGSPILDDGSGNANGVINRDECFQLDLPLENVGCATETGISAVLTTSTPGVTILEGESAYGNIREGESGLNVTGFRAATSSSFVCGTDIAFTLTVSSDHGSTVLHFAEPTCAAPAVRTGSITNSDSTQNARMGRNGIPSDCGGKGCPGEFGAGTRHYDSYSFTNIATGPRCITATLTPACEPASDKDVFSVAYLTSFDPANLCLNYLGDLGNSPANGSSGSYQFTVPAGDTFVIVVNESTAGAGCTSYTLTVEGLIDNADGGRPAPPSAGNNGPVCAGQTLNLTASSIPGATYAWTGPNGFTSTQQNPSIPAATTAASGTYTVVATLGGCQTNPATTSATVHPVPASPAAGSNSPVRVGTTLHLTASTVTGATYQWTGPNGFTSSQQNPSISSVSLAAAGAYSVIATVNGCSSPPATTTVVINDVTPVSLSVDEAGGSGNHNGVFQPGETVSVVPGWQNAGSSTVSFSGALSNFTGPAGPTYTIADGSAGYGSLAGGATTNCATATGDCYALTVTGGRPTAHWDATVKETLTEGAVKTWTLHIGNSFADVPPSNPFYRFVETIFHRGITVGCGSGDFCVNDPVTRAQAAVFLLIAEHGSGYLPPDPTGIFTDVPVSSPFARWVEQLVAEGITAGCGPSLYCPTNPVTRAQTAVFLLRAEHGPSYVPPNPVGIFTDVPVSSPFARWVEQLVAEGITAGCGPSLFCPTTAVTRGQDAVFLTTTFGLKLYGP
jgi:hypothetical protein